MSKNSFLCNPFDLSVMLAMLKIIKKNVSHKAEIVGDNK